MTQQHKVKDADFYFPSKFVLITGILVSNYSLNPGTQFFSIITVDHGIQKLFWF